ncbi:PREDICTED: LOW QUALITY PROTEIN: prohibitin-5, mitochondrial-like [Camelina sativa]|uniref:Prohibitin n=1 Tax=Camelina sativa TaxID=90675 RepID=A0ABM1QD40_CAMSA|nr:PREDICTED: LOW QUALITY PROTEIN: prohibitin-5, mitochondrial-like [Camelina sativa]
MPWNNIRNRKVALGLGAAFMAVTVRSSMFTVEGGQRAVLFDRFNGVLEEPIGEGTYRKIPWVQKPYIFNIRSIAWRLGSNCGTKDLQMVNLSLRVMCRPVVTIGPDVLKAVVAQFNADELLTKLPQVSALIRETLIKRTGVFNIIIDDVSITDLSYSKEFLSAVEWKQVAQQEAELSKFLVAKADQERRAAVIRAEGESESARVLSKAIADAGMGLIELRRIEAAREIAVTLSTSPNVVYLPSGGNMLFAMNGPSSNPSP